jgi:acyl transferase domain-containing protein/acyl carrier protein
VDHQGIAIIGMAGRFPGAKNVAQFWENLCQGVESITFFTDEELLASGADPKVISEPNYVKARPIIDDIESFDAGLFGFSPREAQVFDPQYRLFLECAWEALEMAGYNAQGYKGLIGVFAGASMSTYLLSWIADPQIVQSAGFLQTALGNDKDSLATTVSYKMNLRGPSYTVQTYCSTSLVATHLACQSLLNGECDIALAGGVSIRVPSKQGYVYEQGGQESPDGHCRTFDAQARGTVFGDGIGIVVVKRLEEALADGDAIYAIIKGSAVNNDGALKVGYTAPSVTGQAEAISMALENAGVSPETIGYVEAHGTATEMGDPIEVTALTQAFRKHTNRKGYCAIGSAKTNVGHLDRAAGVTGLIKTTLAVKHGLIPPSLHFESPNPEIDFANSPFYVNTRLTEWVRQNGMPFRAGVNGIGIGGTNAHVIIEEPPRRPRSEPSRPWQLLLLSARTESALDMATTNLAQYLRQDPDVNLADACYTLQVGRRAFEHRRMVICQSVEDSRQTLESGDLHRTSNFQPSVDRSVVFMFPGVGDHYLQMAKELYEGEIVFRDIVEQCCRILRPYLGIRLYDLLYPPGESAGSEAENGGLDLHTMFGRSEQKASPAAKKLQETRVAQPVVFVIEYALARLLMAWGVQPQAMVGYSLGEYVAACLSGVLSLEDALKLVAERAQMIQLLPQGSMMTVSLSKEAVQPFLSESVSLAIHSGETTCVLAGPAEAMAQLEAEFTERGIVYRMLGTSHAIHSSMMTPLAQPLTKLVQTVKLNPPRIPYISDMTGTWITPEQATDPAYWAQHLCRPVCFFDALGELLGDKNRILLEVGPGQSLGSFAKQHPACTPEQVQLILPTMRYVYDKQSDVRFLLETLGNLWLLGLEPDWSGFYQAEQRQRIPLPTYPFEHERYWIESSQRRMGTQVPIVRTDTPFEEAGASPRREMSDWFYLPAWRRMPLLHSNHRQPQQQHWLLFVDDCGLGTSLVKRLQQQGQDVTVVMPGQSFERVQDDVYKIAPQANDDYMALIKHLFALDKSPDRIVHLWNVATERPLPVNEESVDRAQRLGFYSLIFLAQALGNSQATKPVRIQVISNNMCDVWGGEDIRPEKATLLGPVKVIPQEYEQIACSSVDVALPAQMETLTEQILAELMADVEVKMVAYRGSSRWVQSFEPIRLEDQNEEDGITRLRKNGVYLITGGFGGLGFALAERLAQKVQARLVLIGRSSLPPREEWQVLLADDQTDTSIRRRIQQVLTLESSGAEVLAVAADVADHRQMQQAIDDTHERFGPVNGVFHVAGVPGEGLIQLKTPEVADRVLRPKIQGTLVLNTLLQNDSLDFMVLYSSINAIVGGLGEVDYCAANAFLDAFAHYNSNLRRSIPTVSVNWGMWQWDAWQSSSLAHSLPELYEQVAQTRRAYGFTLDEGEQSLWRILSTSLPQVLVWKLDLEAAFRLWDTRSSILENIQWTRSQSRHPRPSLRTLYAAPRDEMEEKIAEIWAEALGIEKIGIHDHFLELGGNSLLGMVITTRLKRELGIDLSAVALYEGPTVSELYKIIRPDRGDEAPLAAVSERGKRRKELREKRRKGTDAIGGEKDFKG